MSSPVLLPPRLRRARSGALRAAAAFVLWSLCAARSVGAYRTAADDGTFDDTARVRWVTNEIAYERTAWIPGELQESATDAAIAAAFAAWTSPECSALVFESLGSTSGVASSVDGRVTVQFVSHLWENLGFASSAAAATDVRYILDASGQWQIADADLFLNAESFLWTTDASSADPLVRDLQAVVTHEVGHVLGLLHPCETGGEGGAPVCSAAHDGVTMHPLYFGSEQRSLAADDVEGACFLYPIVACACADGEYCTPLGCAAGCDGVVCAVGDRCGPTGCTDAPCAPGSCERGCDETCDSPGGADGDPCATDLDCRSAVCAAAGYCTPACNEGLCPDGYLCDTSTSECVARSGTFGAACDEGSDCVSGVCLLDTEAPPSCTRACGEDAPLCPATHACLDVDGTSVCVGPGDGGCRVAPGRASTSRPALLVTILSLIGLAWQRRARQPRRSSTDGGKQ